MRSPERSRTARVNARPPGGARCENVSNNPKKIRGKGMAQPSDLEDRFRGALLGTMVGDALGMPLEGWTSHRIRREVGEVRDMLDGRLERGSFTDDTQMAAALAEALLAAEDPSRPDPGRIAEWFARLYDPTRGYGENTGKLLEAIRGGEPWQRALETHTFPGGSFANGAAMRVAPAALAGHPSPEAVLRLADLQAEATGHTHPEARFGARFQALAVLEGLRSPRGSEAQQPVAFLAKLIPTPTDALGWAEIPVAFRSAFDWLLRYPEATGDEVGRRIGNGVRAASSVPAALWAVLRSPSDPEEVLVRAVSLGGDTDSIAAMAGAIAGALNGASRFPGRWVEALEEGPWGRSRLLDLADELYRRNRGATGSADVVPMGTT